MPPEGGGESHSQDASSPVLEAFGKDAPAAGQHPLGGHAGLGRGRQVKYSEWERGQGCGVKGKQSQTSIKEGKINFERQNEGVAGGERGSRSKLQKVGPCQWHWVSCDWHWHGSAVSGNYGRWDSILPQRLRDRGPSFQMTAFQGNGFQVLEKNTGSWERPRCFKGAEEGFASLSSFLNSLRKGVQGPLFRFVWNKE